MQWGYLSVIAENRFGYVDPMGMLDVGGAEPREVTMADEVFGMVNDKIFLQHCKQLHDNRRFLVSQGKSEEQIRKELQPKLWYY